MPEGSVFVGGLSYSATEKDLEQAFEKYGTVVEAKIITDRETGDSRGFAFVRFEDSNDVQHAIDGADGLEIRGKEISCKQAKPRGDRGSGGGGGFRGGNRGGGRYGGSRGGGGGGYRDSGFSRGGGGYESNRSSYGGR